MKTSAVTDALVAHLVGVRKLAELLAPATPSGQLHPLVGVIREALDTAVALAGAVAEDAHAREAAASAARDESAGKAPTEPPPVFGRPSIVTAPPTGRGIVAIDEATDEAIDEVGAETPSAPVGSP